MTDAHKLLPCPFCGSHPERTYRACQTSIAGWRTDQIHCPQCGYDFEDGDEAWNTRSDLLPALLAAERRKALEEAELFCNAAIRALMEKEQGE